MNPVRLHAASVKLAALSRDIPHLEPGFTVTGSDPLTEAIAGKIPGLEQPVVGS